MKPDSDPTCRPLALAVPPEALLLAWRDAPGLCFLDSADRGGWSLLARDPVEVVEGRHVAERLVPDVRCGAGRSADSGPPFRSGWIGFLAYEAAPAFDPAHRTHPPEPGLPLAWWGRYAAALAFHEPSRVWYLVHSPDALGRTAANALEARLAESSFRSTVPGEIAIDDGVPRESTSLTRATHAERTATILGWIARGHIYQANLTYRVEQSLAVDPVALYSALRAANPAPYGAYLSPAPGLTIQSSSPELFLRVRGTAVCTRPIKGTAGRDPDNPVNDRRIAEALRASVKDRAELTMIVDLERNDLGRVARFGTVRVDSFPEVESYAAVHHLVAGVHADLPPGRSWFELLAASFPGGSVTGAPKIRAMEILSELETAPRFVYTGTLGWIDDRGDGELALAIRTLWTSRGQVCFGVGGGVVADLTAEGEWSETEHKARALRAALQRVARAEPQDRHYS